MHITQLKAENIKRLEAIQITPEGKLIVIGGKNGQGKTSTLDAIMYALAGKKAHCERPLKDGAEHGEVEVRLDDLDLIIRRTFTPGGGGTITVENADGARYKSPQAMLDSFSGALTFDPLAFSRMRPDEQAQALRDLVGLDLSDLDAKRRALYEERRDVNRDITSLKAQSQTAVKHDDVPAKPYDLTELRQERSAAIEANQERDRLVNKAQNSSQQINLIQNQIDETNLEIKRLNMKLETLNSQLNEQKVNANECSAAASKLSHYDIDEIEERIRDAEEANRKIEQNKATDRLLEQLQATKAESEYLTKHIEQIDQDKTRLLAEAQMPIKGLSLEDDTVTYRGIPFSQCSGAEQLRISASICAAMSPRLRVMLIRDGSLLDEDSLKELANIAEQHNTQVWIERVGEGEECQVVIEDGRVKGERD